MKRTIVTLAAVAALAALVAVPAATASQTQVAGLSTPNPDGFSATMTGSLDGVWFLTGADPYWGGGYQVILTGTERFVGTVNGVYGWLDLAFRIETRWDPETFLFVPNGRCQHHVIGSGGNLTGTTGYIQMKDRYDAKGNIVTTYKGHLDVPSAALRTASYKATALPANPNLETVLATCGG